MEQTERIVIRPLTPAERERGLRAIEELEGLSREMLKRRGGEPFPPSWELLDQARDERTRELMGDE